MYEGISAPTSVFAAIRLTKNTKTQGVIQAAKHKNTKHRPKNTVENTKTRVFSTKFDVTVNSNGQILMR